MDACFMTICCRTISLNVLDGDQPLRLIVDRATAAFPWEMACFPSRSGAARAALAGHRSAIVTAVSNAAFSGAGLSPPVNNQLKRARHCRIPRPSVSCNCRVHACEGRRVADILKSANGRDFGSGKMKIEVVERIGAGECDPIEILALLLTGNFDIVHYAGHGDYNAKSPEASGWIFGANTVLAAQDIFRARAVPRMVFANACFSGVLHSGAAFAADELSRGLATIAQAFFERGVPNYIGTGWPVDDAQALTIAASFYQALLQRGFNWLRTERCATSGVRGTHRVHLGRVSALRKSAGSSAACGQFLDWPAYGLNTIGDQHVRNDDAVAFDVAADQLAQRLHRRYAGPSRRRRT